MENLDYRDVVMAIVGKEQEVMGEIALKRAGNVKGVDYNEGTISFSEDIDQETIKQLVEEYKKLQGGGSIGIAREALGNVLETSFDLDLPTEIIPQKIREERFVKGF